MISIQNATGRRSPLIFHSAYQNSLEQIVYKLSREYSEAYTEYALVPHAKYHDAKYHEAGSFYEYVPYPDPDFREAHAYGFLINPFHSRVLVLDIDTPDEETINFIKESFLSLSEVEVLDIAISSFEGNLINGKPKGRHIYAGLNDYYNILSLYHFPIDGCCVGFNNLIVKKEEIVIRVSPKFFMGNKDLSTVPVWEEGYTKAGNVCLKFTQEQLIAPLTSAGVQYFAEPEKTPSHSLKLRG